MGKRGSGKKMLIETVLKKMREEGYNLIENVNEMMKGKPNVLVIKLNGELFSNFVVMYPKLLSYLEEKISGGKSKKLPENITSIFEEYTRKDVSFLVILENLEYFAKEKKLYDFFDAKDNKLFNLYLISFTSKYDILDYLEKRVISRLANDVIKLKGYSESQIKEMMINNLQIEFSSAHVKQYLLTKKLDQNAFKEQAKKWNESLVESFQKYQPNLSNILKIECNLSTLKTLSQMAASHFDFEKEKSISVENLILAEKHLFSDHFDKILLNLSKLELYLLVAAYHIEQNKRYDKYYTFNDLIEEYRQHSKSTLLDLDPFICQKAFESLLELQLFYPVKKGASERYSLSFNSVHIFGFMKKYHHGTVLFHWINNKIDRQF